MIFSPGETILTILDETMSQTTQCVYGNRVFFNIRITDDNNNLYDPAHLIVVAELQHPPRTRIQFALTDASKISTGIYQISYKPPAAGLWNVWDGTDQNTGDPDPSAAIASFTVIDAGVSGV